MSTQPTSGTTVPANPMELKSRPINKDEISVAHHEDIREPTHTAEQDADDIAMAAKNLPPALVDAETARYLDSSIVIDKATNRRIKKMVRCILDCGTGTDDSALFETELT
jgi:hypothetical protein